MKPGKLAPETEPRNQLEAGLHDLTNSLAAARSFGEVLQMRARDGADTGPLKALMEELDRAHGILKRLRKETFRPGDVLRCRECGHEFVHRKAAGRAASCRRCQSSDVERWSQTG